MTAPASALSVLYLSCISLNLASWRSILLGKRHSDPRQKSHRVIVIQLLQHLVRQRQPAHLRLLIFRKVRIKNRARADVGGFPELAMRPPSAGEKIEAAV